MAWVIEVGRSAVVSLGLSKKWLTPIITFESRASMANDILAPNSYGLWALSFAMQAVWGSCRLYILFLVYRL